MLSTMKRAVEPDASLTGIRDRLDAAFSSYSPSLVLGAVASLSRWFHVNQAFREMNCPLYQLVDPGSGI